MNFLNSHLLNILLIFGLLAGCTQAGTATVVSTAEPTAPPTVTSSPIPSITPSPTLQYDKTILTAVASVRQTRAAPFSPSCTPFFQENIPIDIPEPDTFFWEGNSTSAGTLKRLNGLSTQIVDLDPSPNGRWVVISLLYQELGYAAYSTYLYILDTVENQHWVLSRDESDKNTYQWLPDGRILWIDDGNLFAANGNGTNQHALNIPAPVHEIWLGADGIALISGEEDLWWFSIEDEIWEKVPGIGGVSSPGANLNLSMDGTFAAVNISGDISIVPLSFGSPARLLLDAEPIGRDGRAGAPRPIPNSPYWKLPDIEISGDDNRWVSTLLDMRDGSLHSSAEFLPEGTHRIEDFSPDGQWVYAWNFNPKRKIDDVFLKNLYIAPSSDLKAGSTVFTGVEFATEVVGWETNPSAVLIRPFPGSKEIVQISLDTFKSEVVPALPQFFSWPNGIRFALIEQDDVTKRFKVQAFSQTNEAVGILDLPENTKSAQLYPIGESEVLIVIKELANQVSDTCYYDYHLWLWKVNS